MSRPTPVGQRHPRPIDRLAYAIATGAGAGFAPVAPGTFGAVEGVIAFLAFNALAASTNAIAPRRALALFVIINVALFIAGVWASGRACEMCALEDPGQVVIDEVSGQMIALTPLVAAHSVAGMTLAFLLFRLFDIFKPYPIRSLERLHGGLGVMADDALAGVYAAALVWVGIQSGLI